MMRAMPVSHHELARAARRRGTVAPVASRALAAGGAAPGRSACACGGSCPRCQAGAPLIQRQALPGSESASIGDAGTPAPADPLKGGDDDSVDQMCGTGNIKGQVYMCCFDVKTAPEDDPCWMVAVNAGEACFARHRENPKVNEICSSEQNFAMCRCLGKPRCQCGGIV